MKVNLSLLFLILLAVYSVVTTFGQEKSILETEFFRLKDIKLPQDVCSGDICTIHGKTEKFIQIFVPLLSENGSIEFDDSTQTLIFTDTKNRVKLLNELVKILDDSGLAVDNLFENNFDQRQRASFQIKLQNLELSIGCGTGNGKNTWQQTQGRMLTSIITKIFAPTTFEVNGRERTITGYVEGNRDAAIIQIAQLFDKPFLAEEFEN